MERFWSKVKKGDGCWEWHTTSKTGYGYFRIDGRSSPAHRVAYELMVGPIPEGLHIDHLCRNRACVNPDHLEAVTNRVNTLRGVGFCAQRARQTHCKRGHPLEGDNLKIDSKGCRQCVLCLRMHNRRNKIKTRKGETPPSVDDLLATQPLNLRAA